MTLSFAEQLNQKATHFVEKIWQSLLTDNIEMNAFLFSEKLKQIIPKIGKMKVGDFHQKRHTIREDKSNKWKAGNDIHMVINNRTPDRFQFAPTIKCISTQLIWIKSLEKKILVENYIDDNKTIPDNFFWKELQEDEVLSLIKNDGFDSVDEFWNYFNKDFSGKIIHWTNLKY
jgi:hypothetical protein